MAILESVPGIKVQVLVWGQPQQEYDNYDTTGADTRDSMGCPVVCKYIESFDNAEFAIYIKIANYPWGYRNHLLRAAIYIDGKLTNGVIFAPPVIPTFTYTEKVEGKGGFDPSTNSWVLRRFKFAAIHTIDEAQNERVSPDMELSEELGTIKVEFSRVVTGVRADPIPTSSAHSGDVELTGKSLKGRAITHGTWYKRAHAINTPFLLTSYMLPEDRGPIAVYKFFYRSKGKLKPVYSVEQVLKRELIIPSGSPTVEAPTDDDIIQLAFERLMQLDKIKVKDKILKHERDETQDVKDGQDDIALESPSVKRARRSLGSEANGMHLTRGTGTSNLVAGYGV
ncbi:hypothetical protein F4775DRAFT_596426 [Biscogniauxia sp. FL1348]|nr:hypothetical protein F4775DRAFT_596426 [Biscogniauxia sp. FL1348]